MTRIAIQLAGPVLTLLGVWLSIWGTFKITKSYHPLRGILGFFGTVVKLVLMFVTGKQEAAVARLMIMARFAVNSENREQTLVGVFLIFVGLITQGIGSMFWLADAIWGAVVQCR